MAFELVLLGISFLFLTFSIFYESIDCQVFTLLLLVVAAADAAAGLALVVIFNRLTNQTLLTKISRLRG